MKYSQTLGIVLCVLLIGAAYLPWAEKMSTHSVLTGMDTSAIENLWGKPGLMHISLSVMAIVFFAISKVWSKRINVFVAGINLAWAIRNWAIYNSYRDSYGELMHVKYGLYISCFLSFCILIMSFLPKMKVRASEL